MHLSVKPTSKLVFPIRTVVEYDLDRPGVEVRQRMELTGTNSPIDFILHTSRLINLLLLWLNRL